MGFGDHREGKLSNGERWLDSFGQGSNSDDSIVLGLICIGPVLLTLGLDGEEKQEEEYKFAIAILACSFIHSNQTW